MLTFFGLRGIQWYCLETVDFVSFVCRVLSSSESVMLMFRLGLSGFGIMAWLDV